MMSTHVAAWSYCDRSCDFGFQLGLRSRGSLRQRPKFGRLDWTLEK